MRFYDLFAIGGAAQSTFFGSNNESHYTEEIKASGLLGSHFGQPANATYDYIIVGGGTSGLTIARRLAENGTFSVAVIEAGTFAEFVSGNSTQIPGNGVASAMAPPAAIDWAQQTTPQTGLANRVLHYARGKAFGGSSNLNLMWYVTHECLVHNPDAACLGTKGHLQEPWTLGLMP